MQSKSMRAPVNNDPRAVFLGRHSANVIDASFALRASGFRPVDGVTWLYDQLGEQAAQAIVAGNRGDVVSQAAGLALFHAARVVWVLTATDPAEALSQAAADLVTASQTERPSGLFIIESSESGTLLRALAELAIHWPNVSVEVTPLRELPARVIAWCSTGSEVGGAQ